MLVNEYSPTWTINRLSLNNKYRKKPRNFLFKSLLLYARETRRRKERNSRLNCCVDLLLKKIISWTLFFFKLMKTIYEMFSLINWFIFFLSMIPRKCFRVEKSHVSELFFCFQIFYRLERFCWKSMNCFSFRFNVEFLTTVEEFWFENFVLEKLVCRINSFYIESFKVSW